MNLARRIAPTLDRKPSSARLRNSLDGGQVSSSDPAVLEFFGAQRTAAAAHVSPTSAMRVAVVFRCVNLIGAAIAGLPQLIYQRDGDVSRRVDHDYWWLLNEQPAPLWSAAAFWEFALIQMLLRGDSINPIVRDRTGRITAILPWARDMVRVQREPNDDPRAPRRNQYFFQGPAGNFGLEQEDVLHFPGFGFNGMFGMSVIQWGARNGIGIAIRGDEFAGAFYAGGAKPQIILQTPNELTPTQRETLLAAYAEKYSNQGPTGVPLVLTEGLVAKELSLTAADAQLLEARNFQVVDICRAFGVPPHMAGEMTKATYANTENLGVDFVKYTLASHLQRIEQELNIKLWPRSLKLFAKFNTDELMRGDVTARAAYYKAALGGTQSPAWMRPNEVRRLENLPPDPDGNTLSKPKDTTNAQPDPNAPPPAQ